MRAPRAATLAVLAAALLPACAAPGAGGEAPLFPAPEAAGREHAAAVFEKFRALAGSWKGEFGMGGQKGPMAVDYRVTGGGSAVEETLFRGTPHEMVTLYHLDGARMILTHYCAAGNQPTMVLVPGSDPAKPRFEFLRATNLADAKEGHMHEADFDLSEAGRLRAKWTYWAEGKPGHAAEFDAKRAAP